MTSRLGRRVIHFANLPIKLQLPKTLTNITEISLRTIPSATKIEIKRVLESLYGFEVEKVRTLNMDGKMKKRGGLLIAKPDYKKAYVTLKSPLELSRDVFPVRLVEEERKGVADGAGKGKGGGGGVRFVEEDGGGERRHWLDGEERDGGGRRAGGYVNRMGKGMGKWGGLRGGVREGTGNGKWGGVRGGGEEGTEKEKGLGMLKFPWSSLRGGGGGGNGNRKGVAKFPWSSMGAGRGGGR